MELVVSLYTSYYGISYRGMHVKLVFWQLSLVAIFSQLQLALTDQNLYFREHSNTYSATIDLQLFFM